MSDTPRITEHLESLEASPPYSYLIKFFRTLKFARQLERELNEANEKINEWEALSEKNAIAYTVCVIERDELEAKLNDRKAEVAKLNHALGVKAEALKEAQKDADWISTFNQTKEQQRRVHLDALASLLSQYMDIAERMAELMREHEEWAITEISKRRHPYTILLDFTKTLSDFEKLKEGGK